MKEDDYIDMRCLYCGKELALLKRFTSGGEFCSDAHRQQYQEEYNQLALNRLLQAKPPADAKTEKKKTEETRQAPAQQTPAQPSAPAPEPVMVAAPSAPAPAPAMKAIEPPQRPAPSPEPLRSPVAVEEEPVPAELAGFLFEIPIPATAELMTISVPDLEMEHSATPAVPPLEFEIWETELVPAGQVHMHQAISMLNSPGRPLDRGVDVREFGRSIPVVEVDLRRAAENALPEATHDPMEISTDRYSPPEAASLWQEPALEFAGYELELGQLARVTFATTGFEERDANSSDTETADVEIPEAKDSVAPPAVVLLPPDPVPAPPATPAPQNVAIEAETPAVFRPRFSEPVQTETPAAEIQTARKAEPKTKTKTEPKPEPKIEPTPEPVPELVTRTLPLTLHGVAAGRGKPLPVFTTGIAATVDVHIPRSTGLPLRPVMLLEPVPASPKVEESKAEEKKPAERVIVKQDVRRGRQDSRFANGKLRKPETKTPEVETKAPEAKEEEAAAPLEKAIEKTVEKAPEKSPEKSPEKTIEKAFEKPAPEISAKPEPKVETARDVPAPRPYIAPDLGLPSLSMQPESFWTKLPVAAKLGAAAAAVILIVLVIYLSSKGGSADAAGSGPHVVEAPALATGESGWITDWGTEPGVRRQNDISILRASMSLTDYRLEFQAQIESKSIGWVYRAVDGKNYYISKLEIVKPGINPAVAVVRYAIVKGEEQPRSQFPLPMKVNLDTVYNIRFDAVGDHFTTWVQDQKIDDFTDDRIKTGGVGLFTEHGERSGLIGAMRVAPLVIKK